MIDRADETPGAWADRRAAGDGAPPRGTSGAASGTSGAPTGGVGIGAAWTNGSVRGWALVIALVSLVTFVNVMTQLDDAKSRGVRLPLALPLTLEVTSAVAAICASIVIAITLRLAPPDGRPIWRTIGVHAVGSLVFSVAHVGLMTLLRIGLFDLAGETYTSSLRELPYEYRKDLLSYLVFGTLFWFLSRPRAAAPATRPPTPGAPASFDIRDGASILRVPVGEILAASAAGNYVEFMLENGKRPLMRASLGAVQTALAPHGFLRTHRSWLVNGARVRALTAAGSGDFRLDLGCGLTAPLSRRYPEALSRLKEAPPRLQ